MNKQVHSSRRDNPGISRRGFLNLSGSISNLYSRLFGPDVIEVYAGDKLLGAREKTASKTVFDSIVSFDPPFGEVTMPTPDAQPSLSNARYTHDYTVEVDEEGYQPQLVITPPAGSVLEYEVEEAVPTEDPLLWMVRISLKVPPGQVVTEEPVVDFYALPVGMDENSADPAVFALGKIIASTYGVDVHYLLRQPAAMSAAVFTLTGRLVENMDLGSKPKGEHSFHWESYKYPAGVYIIHITIEGQAPVSLKIVKR